MNQSRTPFFCRQKELDQLEKLTRKRTASLVIVKGRRRIGKSRLIEEFVQNKTSYTFIGLPPDPKVSAKLQRETFRNQMEQQLDVPGIDAKDWGSLFWHLANKTKTGKVVLVFDEINWMGFKDPTFLGKLKNSWDRDFKQNPELILILSGSMSAWIEKNIIHNTGFVGRVSLDMTLNELPLPQCNHFWFQQQNLVSSYEKFKILSVTGGIPRYLEEIDPTRTALENICSLCFEKEGFLFNEFEKIFSDLFSTSHEQYRKILQRLGEGTANLEQISQCLEVKKGGTVTKYLENLVTTGYVAQDKTWNLKEGSVSKLSHFRLKDNYIRFYLRYIFPNIDKIKKEIFSPPPNWEAIMGLQFENLVLNNSKLLWKIVGIQAADILFENPFFQRKSKTQSGCQIDYLVQTRFNILYVFEIKFSKNPIGLSIVNEVKEKIDRIHTPKNFTFIPILIHVNGVTSQVIESRFFSHIIDFGELLT
jgi:AAA+ ATPase superfamily predicted ATPase